MREAAWLEAKNIPKLAFDHDVILLDALEFIRENRVTRKKRQAALL